MKESAKNVNHSFQKLNTNYDNSFNNIQQLKSHIDSNFAIITELFLNLYHIKPLTDPPTTENLSLKSPLELILYIKKLNIDSQKEIKEFRTTTKTMNDRILSLSSKIDSFDKTLNENVIEMNQQIQSVKNIPGILGKFQKYKSLKEFITNSDSTMNHLTYDQKKLDINMKMHSQKITDNLADIQQKFEQRFEQFTKLINTNIRESEAKLLSYYSNLNDELNSTKELLDYKSNLMKKNFREEINKNFLKMLEELKEDGDPINLKEFEEGYSGKKLVFKKYLGYFIEKKVNQILETNNINNQIKEKKTKKKTTILGKGKKLELNLVNFTPQNKQTKLTPLKNNKSMQFTEEILNEKKNAFFKSSARQKKLFTSNSSQILRSNKISLTKKLDSVSLLKGKGKLFDIIDETQKNNIIKSNEKFPLPKVQIKDINQKNKFNPILKDYISKYKK